MQKITDAQIYANKALQLRREGKYSQSIINYKKAISLNPNYGAAYTNWGYAISLISDSSNTILRYIRATYLNPSGGTAYYNLAIAYADADRYAEAIENLNKALSLGHNASKVNNNLGYALSCLEKHNAAIEKFKEAIRHQRDYDIAYINWGIELYYLGKQFKAKQAIIIGTLKAVDASHTRLRDIFKIYSKQIDVDNKKLTAVEDEESKLRFKSKIEALEGVRSILELSYDKLRMMLVPSTYHKKDDVRVEILEYYNLLSRELLRVFRESFDIVGIQLEERELAISQFIRDALKQIPIVLETKLSIFAILVSSTEAGSGELSDIDQSQIRQSNKVYKDFIDHFVSFNEIKYVVEALTSKCAEFRAHQLLCEHCEEKAVMNEDMVKEFEETKDLLKKYGQIDVAVITIICLLEGVEVKGYECMDQKIENIAEAIFRKVKTYIE